MTKAEKWQLAGIAILLALLFVVWIYYYLVGSPSFNKENAISIYGTIVQGMSALLSVSIAVIIFRVQSLENRNQSLEQSTLNFIFLISQYTYPKWSSYLEEHIRKGVICKRYYERHGSEEDRDNQQKRLMDTLNEHVKVEKTILETRRGAYSSFVLLILPILISFLLLLISDTMGQVASFYSVSLVILLCVFGIVSLVATVLQSIVTK